MTPTRTSDLLRTLAAHDVRYIVVGMTAAVLQGAPVATLDLDIVYDRSADNVLRLLRALDEIEAVFRNTPGRRIAPNESHLASTGHKLLLTSYGVLDVLGELADAEGYHELLPDSVELEVGPVSVRVLSLARLIEVKARAGRPKDIAALPVLRATLQEATARASATGKDPR